MSIAISDALQQAQQAVEGGDYRSAVQTCNQLVNQYPDYAAAYRVLGEAYLEQGQTADAEQAFAQALLRDPRQAWAYHGLGLIAEGQEVLENALAFCQVAWELAPNQSRLRDPVIRIATRRFGADGHAQLTSAALAQIYSSTSRLQRAASEYRSALADLPDRVDLKLGLAETLWQLNRNEEAAEISRQVLEENPVAIQALVVLADIEGRAGNDAEATDLRERIRAIDPDGSTTSMMLSRNEHANRDALLLSKDAIPVLADATETGVAERPHIAPAPDFSYQPARAEHPVLDIEDLEPISAEEFGTEPDPEQTDNLSTRGTAAVEAAEDAADDHPVAFADDAPSVYRTDEDVDRLDLGQQVRASEPPSTTGDDAGDDDLDALMAEFGDVEPMGIEEFGAEPEDLERLAAAAEQDLFSDDDDDMFAGFGPASPSEEGTNAHVRSLASALESDVAGALGRTGEFQIVPSQAETEDVDQETEAEQEPVLEVAAEAEAEPSTPDPLSGTGYTTVLRELGDEGFTPFDPMGRADLQDSHAREQSASGPGEGAEAETPAEENELLKLTKDWESIDDEISRAVPLTTGQTDQLRAADDLGIDPFDFETEDDTSRLPAFRPFGEDDDELPDPDAALEAVSGEDDVLAVDEPAGDDQLVEPESETAQTTSSEDELFESLEPFSMEEFDNESASEQAFSFGALPWETGDSGSAVPSNADMDLLLSSEDGPAVESEADPVAPPVAPDWPTTVLDTSSEQTDEPVDWTIAIQDDVVAESQPEPVLEVEHDPAESTWTPPADWDASLAVTRQIGDPVDDDFAQRLAEAEAAAQTAQDQHEQIEDDLAATSGPISGTDPETLVADQDLFERTRSAKTDLISQGTISGDLDMAGSAPEPESEPDLAVEVEPDMDQVVEEPYTEDVPAEDDFVVATGSSRDVNTLRASLEVAPNDDELRWWLAEALRERGEIDEAYAEYRWIIRNAGHRSDDVINALNECIEQEQYAEMGHRLLADIYRRRGAVSLASNHAATAMAVRRRLRG